MNRKIINLQNIVKPLFSSFASFFQIQIFFIANSITKSPLHIHLHPLKTGPRVSPPAHYMSNAERGSPCRCAEFSGAFGSPQLEVRDWPSPPGSTCCGGLSPGGRRFTRRPTPCDSSPATPTPACARPRRQSPAGAPARSRTFIRQFQRPQHPLPSWPFERRSSSSCRA